MPLRYTLILLSLHAAALHAHAGAQSMGAFVAPHIGVVRGTTIDAHLFSSSLPITTRTGLEGGIALGVPVREWMHLYTNVGLSRAKGDAFGTAAEMSLEQLEAGIRVVRRRQSRIAPFAHLGLGARDLDGGPWRMRGLFLAAGGGVEVIPHRSTVVQLGLSHAAGGYTSLEHRELYFQDPQPIRFSGDPQTSGGGMTRLTLSLAWYPAILAAPPTPPAAERLVDGKVMRFRVVGTTLEGELLSHTSDSLLLQLRKPALRQISVPLVCVGEAQMLQGYTSRGQGMARRGLLGLMVGTVVAALLAKEHVFNDSVGDDMGMLAYGATVALPAGVVGMLTGRGGGPRWQRVALSPNARAGAAEVCRTFSY